LVIPTGGTTGFVHVVQRGETLTMIAARYGVSTSAIAQANGLYNVNYIYVGQRLVIPGASSGSSGSTSGGSTSSGSWRGEYYSGATPSGGPVFVRSDAAINFNWGSCSPDSRLPCDGFSVHWTRTFSFRGGLYRFTLTADDSGRVYVDGNLVLDAWAGQAGATRTADVSLTPGSHLIAVDYADGTGAATVAFSFQRIGSGTCCVTPTCASATPTTTVGSTTTTPPPPGAGWYAQYYHNEDLLDPPVATSYDPWIGFDWGTGNPMPGVPSDNFSARWTTTAYFEAGSYNFCAMIDDGARIWVDGVRVLDEWHPTNGLSYCGQHSVTAGNHVVKVEYFEGGGNALIYVWWE
jgi:hypothetical protein